jgi:hypothetical protein
MWYLSRNFADQPFTLKFFFLGIFFATILGMMINNFYKISMHAMGVGGVIIFSVLTCFYYQIYLGADISLIFLIAGLVCTSRFIASDHNNMEIYSGIIVGAVCQLIAFWISV